MVCIMTKIPAPSAIRKADRDLAAMLEQHEGRRSYPYHDHVGKLTIGVGRNLDDRGLSTDEIDVLLANDISIARSGCRALFPAFDGFNSKRQAGLISMAFNLGQTRDWLDSGVCAPRSMLVTGQVPALRHWTAIGQVRLAAAPVR